MGSIASEPCATYLRSASKWAATCRGATWHSLCADLPTAAVYDLVVHPRDPELVIGTHGRSIFVADITMIREAAKEVK